MCPITAEHDRPPLYGARTPRHPKIAAPGLCVGSDSASVPVPEPGDLPLDSVPMIIRCAIHQCLDLPREAPCPTCGHMVPFTTLCVICSLREAASSLSRA